MFSCRFGRGRRGSWRLEYSCVMYACVDLSLIFFFILLSIIDRLSIRSRIDVIERTAVRALAHMRREAIGIWWIAPFNY